MRDPRDTRSTDRAFSPIELRVARTRRKLSQEQLAELIGRERKAIVAYEGGKRTPPGRVIILLARVLDVPPGSLLARETEGQDTCQCI